MKARRSFSSALLIAAACAVALAMLFLSCASKAPVVRKDQYEVMDQKVRDAPPDVPLFAKGYNDAAIGAYQVGQYERAVELWRKAIAAGGPGYALLSKTYYNIGLAYIAMDRPEWASDELTRAAALDAKNYEIQKSLAEVCINLGDQACAAKAIQRCIELNGESPELMDALGSTSLSKGDYPTAVKAFLNELSTSPDSKTAKDNLEKAYLAWAASLYGSGDYAGALDKYAQAIEVDPSKGQTYYLAARCHLMLGDFDKAIETYRRAHELAPELAEEEGNNLISKMGAPGADTDPALVLQTAELYVSKGLYPAAAREYRKAIALTPKNYDLYLKLARLYAENLNDRKTAVQWYHAFLSAAPDDPRTELVRKEIARESAPPAQAGRTPEPASLEAGLNYDPASGKVTDPGTRFPSGSRVYRVIRLKNMWGPHILVRRLLKPDGKAQYEENLTREFFEDEISLVSTDRCSVKGAWKQEWSVDGLPTGELEFEIY